MRNGHKTALRPMPVPPAEDHDGDNGLRRTHAGASTTHLKARLAEAGENTAAILKVVEALDQADSVDKALLAALNTVREAFGWVYGTFWTFDEGERVLRFALESGSIAEEFRRMTMAERFHENEGLPGRAWKSRPRLPPRLRRGEDLPQGGRRAAARDQVRALSTHLR